jgi:hypothetical protein
MNAKQIDIVCDLTQGDPEKRKHYTRFLVTSGFGWGFGKTIAEAKENCRKEAPKYQRSRLGMKAKIVTEDTTCDGAGVISYRAEFPPIELGEI